MGNFGVVTGIVVCALFSGGIASADECVGQICVGKLVIDQNQDIGSVVAVGPTAVTYTVPGYSPETVTPSQVSWEVAGIGAIIDGAVVIDTNQNIGSVNHVFANGETQYTVPGYNPSINLASTLSAQVQSLPGHADISTGITVIDSNQNIGKVNQVFANGSVQYTVPGYNPSIAPVAQLSALVSNDGPIKVGSVVIDSNQNIGNVQEIFENGEVQYTVPGYNPSIAQGSTLSVAVSTIGALSAGVTVIDSNEDIGKVQQLFANRLVQYTVPGYNPTIASSQTLSPMVNSLSAFPTIVSGVTVMDANGNVGTVGQLFANGEITYTVPGYNPSIIAVGNLSPEVATSALYQKGTYYASDSYLVGKAVRFFADGRVELQLDDGSVSSAKILYAQVAQLNGYASGTSVTASGENTGTVNAVFANGAITYTYQLAPSATNPNPKPISTWAKTVGANPSQVTSDEQQWLENLGWTIDAEQQNPASAWELIESNANLVDRTADYPAFRKTLLAVLNAQPGLVIDPTLRAAVIADLSK